VELTFQPGASVVQIAQVNGVNVNQVFKRRPAFQRGELAEASSSGTRAFLPVMVSGEATTREPSGQLQPVISSYNQ
jgi:transposase-like protein